MMVVKQCSLLRNSLFCEFRYPPRWNQTTASDVQKSERVRFAGRGHVNKSGLGKARGRNMLDAVAGSSRIH
jgi:hypothetical protein